MEVAIRFFYSIFYFDICANQNLIHPILLAWSISIFVYEFISINLIRLQNNQNVFTAGLDHLHHILFQKLNQFF